MKLSSLLTKWNSKKVEYKNILLETLEENKEQMADMNIEQLEKGRTVNNDSIEPFLCDEVYAKHKKANGGIAPLGVSDHKDTGSFYSGFQCQVFKNLNVRFFSTDEKDKLLLVEYPETRGLNKQNKSIIIKEMQRDFINFLRK